MTADTDSPERNGIDVELLLRQARTFLAFSEQLQPLSTHFSEILNQEGDWNRTFERYLTELKAALAEATNDPHEHPELARVWATSLDLWQQAVTSLGIPMAPQLSGSYDREAWQTYQTVQADYLTLLRTAATEALDLMEQRLRERVDAGETISGLRDVYNVWIACNEETYTHLLHRPEYSAVSGNLLNTLLQCYASMKGALS